MAFNNLSAFLLLASQRIAFFNYTDAKGYTPLDFYWFALRDHLPRLCPDVEDQPNQLYTWGTLLLHDSL